MVVVEMQHDGRRASTYSQPLYSLIRKCKRVSYVCHGNGMNDVHYHTIYWSVWPWVPVWVQNNKLGKYSENTGSPCRIPRQSQCVGTCGTLHEWSVYKRQWSCIISARIPGIRQSYGKSTWTLFCYIYSILFSGSVLCSWCINKLAITFHGYCWQKVISLCMVFVDYIKVPDIFVIPINRFVIN